MTGTAHGITGLWYSSTKTFQPRKNDNNFLHIDTIDTATSSGIIYLLKFDIMKTDISKW